VLCCHGMTVTISGLAGTKHGHEQPHQLCIVSHGSAALLHNHPPVEATPFVRHTWAPAGLVVPAAGAFEVRAFFAAGSTSPSPCLRASAPMPCLAWGAEALLIPAAGLCAGCCVLLMPATGLPATVLVLLAHAGAGAAVAGSCRLRYSTTSSLSVNLLLVPAIRNRKVLAPM